MKRLALALLPVLLAAVIHAANISTATYLLLSAYPDHEAAGASCASALYGNSASAVNPAALAGAENFNYDIMQAFLPGSMLLQKLTLSKAFEAGVFGLDAGYYNFGSYQAVGADDNLMPTVLPGTADAYSASAAISYAKRVSNLGTGITLRGMYESLAGETVFVPLLDAGFVVDGIWNDRISLGASLLNVSPEQDGYAPPAVINTGFAYYLNGRADNYINLHLGAACLVREGDFKAEAGVSFTPVDILTLRGGISGGSNRELAFSGGVSVRISGITLNYSYSPAALSGAMHKISISGGGADKPAEEAAAEKPEKGGSYDTYRKSGDYYYEARAYKQAAKYYEYINLLYWKEVEDLSDREKSNFYQRLGICYYNMRDNRRALSYFDRAMFYEKDNEILKHWIKLLK
ncbi:MAG: hypothetical protein LLG37_02990 [Spirochaetia bacterium]|nr:hypothetical protein [Spirochaetia bacterium]